MRSAFVVVALAACSCSAIAGVDWDRVTASSGTTLPDGAPGGDDASSGGVPSGSCSNDQVECLTASGVACCQRNDDVGTAVAIAAGTSNTCAVTSTGLVRCWGSNASGQLGRGQTPSLPKANRPLTVFRIPSGAKQVTVGQSHACAIVDTLLACWGANTNGQLGTGGTDPAPLPVVVPTRAPPDSIGSGEQTVCASIGGQGYCWGDNSGYQAGNEVDAHVLQPKLVTGLGTLASGARVISAGHEYSCAASSAGLMCWGNNTQLRLGSNGVSNIGKATAVTNGTGVASDVTTGEYHGCAIRGGGLLCWGGNTFGELGLDSVSFQSDGAIVPTNMTSGVTSVCAGFEHTCAVKNGGVLCTGGNAKGQTASGTGSSRVFLAVAGLESGVKQVACGELHTCALLQSGAIKCWGLNQDGQLGDGTNDDNAQTPRDVLW